MACFICLDDSSGPSGLFRLGCACRSDNGVAHVECMARFARAIGRGEWRTCRTCRAPLSGPMLHLLNGRAAGSIESSEAVCRIHEIACELAVASGALNGRTCFRVPMPPGIVHRALSVAARGDESGLYYETVLIDESDKVVHSSTKRFGVDETHLLIRHARSLLSLQSEPDSPIE